MRKTIHAAKLETVTLFPSLFLAAASLAHEAPTQLVAADTGASTSLPAMVEGTGDGVLFNLPAQPLLAALKAFAEQADVQLIYKHEVVKRATANAVVGRYERHEALKQLLKDTGLEGVFTTEDAATIRPRQTTALNPGDVENTTQGLIHFAQNMAIGNANAGLESSIEGSGKQSMGSDASAASRDSSDESQKLEEVVVTAQRRQERLQDVPMSVSAITGEDIEARGATDIRDLAASIPGLAWDNTERGQGHYSIRGIVNSTVAPTVGVYLDDVPLITPSSPFTGGFDVQFFDIERVEVLKGPQGTLYGGSALGGAIRYISALPDLNSFSGSVSAGAELTEHGDEGYSAHGVLNLPLVEGVIAARLGLQYRHEGGYTDLVPGNIALGNVSATPYPNYTPAETPYGTLSEEDANYADTYTARATLLWTPAPGWSVRPSVLFQDYERNNGSGFLINRDGLENTGQFLSGIHDTGTIYSVDISGDLGGVELTSITSFIDRRVVWQADYSTVFQVVIPDFQALAHYPATTHTLNQEVRLSSPSDSDGPLAWTVGAFYSTQADDFPGYVLSTDTTSIFGANNYNGLFGPPLADLLYGSAAEKDQDELSVFADGTYSLTDALHLSVGARYFEIELDYANTESGVVIGPVPNHGEGTQRERGVSPRVALSYDLDADHMVFASAANGFRPGGINTSAGTQGAGLDCATALADLGLSGRPTGWESDSLWTYEIGSKNEFNGGRTIFNASLFYTDWTNIQQGVSVPQCGGILNLNAGDAVVQGAELEARFHVGPHWEFGGTLGYTHGEIVDAAPTTGAYDGVEVLQTPEWTGGIYALFETALNANWDLQARAECAYRGEQRLSFSATRSLVLFPDGLTHTIPNGAEFQEDYSIVNAYTSISNGKVNFRFYVNNLLDERPVLQLLTGVPISAQTLRPRTIGLEISRDF